MTRNSICFSACLPASLLLCRYVPLSMPACLVLGFFACLLLSFAPVFHFSLVWFVLMLCILPEVFLEAVPLPSGRGVTVYISPPPYPVFAGLEEAQEGIQAVQDPKLDKVMQDSFLAIQITTSLTLVDLPYGKRAIEQNRNPVEFYGELTFFLGLQVTQKDDGIFISQDKYVDEILKNFGFSTVKTTSTPMETSKPLLKDAEAEDVDVHLYRSMIGSLMYLTASRPDIIYLKGQPKLGLWYPKDSPFDLEAYTDSDYAGASLDRKSTTRGCQFLGRRLILWQCKKQTIVANSTTKAEYVVAASCCRQVLWIQNQMLDYGYNFMNTKIFIDNESTICIVKNPVFHSKTKHIEIRHHFIRDSNEKKLIQMIKIHTNHNVADLLTKAFDVGRFQYLIASIGMLNL
ncbi:hypothetical protein Tco_0903675 [Tanacetum coccineum]